MPTYNIVNPAESLQTFKPMSLGDIVNLGRGMQQYKAENIELQKAQQANTERLAIQDWMSNPDNYTVDIGGGQRRVDVNKLSHLNTIAPLTGGEWQSKLLNTAYNETVADQAKSNLTAEAKTSLAQVFNGMALSGNTKKEDYFKAMDEWAATSGSPYAGQLVTAYKNNTAGLPDDDPRVAQTFKMGAVTLMPQSDQNAAYGPKAGVVQTPTGTFVSATQVNPATGAVSTTVAPQPFMPTPFTVIGQDPVTQQYISEGYDPATGRLVRTLNPPSNVTPESGATQQLSQQFQQRQPVQEYTPPSLAQQQGAQAGPTYLTEANAARASVKSASDALNNIDVITKYLPNAYVGGSLAASAKQVFTGQLGGIAAGKNEFEAAAAAREIVQKNIAGLVAQANAAGNGKYASDLQQQADALASAEKTPTAIYSSLEQLRPLLLQTKNYSQGLDAAIKNNPQKGHLIKPEYDSAMNKAYDPVVVAFHDIYQKLGGDQLYKNVTPQKKAEVDKKLADAFQQYAFEHKISQAQINNAKGKIGAYNSLVKGIIP